jgi:hypothetical protein
VVTFEEELKQMKIFNPGFLNLAIGLMNPFSRQKSWFTLVSSGRKNFPVREKINIFELQESLI